MKSQQTSNAPNRRISSVLENLVGRIQSERRKTIELGEVVQAFGRTSFGPMIFVPALISLLPLIGGIPGVSIATATWILLIAVQMPFRPDHVWLPQKLMRWKISGSSFQKAIEKSLPWIRPPEKFLKPRVTWLTRRPGVYLTALAIILSAALMYPFAIIPYAVTAPSLALTLMAMGLTVHDGLVVSLGIAATLGAALIGWFIFV